MMRTNDDAYDNPYDDEYEDDYDDNYDDRYDDRYGDNRYDNRRDRKYRDSSSRAVSGTRRRKKRRRSYRPTRLAAPIQKGGNTLLRIVQTIVRNLSALLILAIIGLMAYTFLRGSAPYGDLKQEISSNNYTIRLASYIAVAAFLSSMNSVHALDNDPCPGKRFIRNLTKKTSVADCSLLSLSIFVPTLLFSSMNGFPRSTIF